MPDYQLAQLNVARLVAPIDSPELADFVAKLEDINGLAEQSPGYVWRLQTEEGDATSISYFGDEIIPNLTVWEDVESLHQFVYRTAHAKIMSRRKEWFQRMREAYTVLWWIPQGHIPSLQEAEQRLTLLRENGPTPEASTFKKAFPDPSAGSSVSARFEELCPAC